MMRWVRLVAVTRTCSPMSRTHEHWPYMRALGIDATDRFANLTSEVSQYASSASSNRFEPAIHENDRAAPRPERLERSAAARGTWTLEMTTCPPRRPRLEAR